MLDCLLVLLCAFLFGAFLGVLVGIHRMTSKKKAVAVVIEGIDIKEGRWQ